jgi:hypothetical protein
MHRTRIVRLASILALAAVIIPSLASAEELFGVAVATDPAGTENTSCLLATKKANNQASNALERAKASNVAYLVEHKFHIDDCKCTELKGRFSSDFECRVSWRIDTKWSR